MRGRSSRAASEAGGQPSVGERGISEVADETASVGGRSFASGLEMIGQEMVVAENALIPSAQESSGHVVNETLGSSGSTELRAASVEEDHDGGRAALAALVAGEEVERGTVASGQTSLHLEVKSNPFWSEAEQDRLALERARPADLPRGDLEVFRSASGPALSLGPAVPVREGRVADVPEVRRVGVDTQPDSTRGASWPAGFPSSGAGEPAGLGRGSVGAGRVVEEELHRARPGVEAAADGRQVRPIVGTRPSWSREHGVASIPMPEPERGGGPSEKQWSHMRSLVESLVNQNLNLQDRLDRMEEEAAMRSATSGGGGAPPSADTVDLIDLEPRRIEKGNRDPTPNM